MCGSFRLFSFVFSSQVGRIWQRWRLTLTRPVIGCDVELKRQDHWSIREHSNQGTRTNIRSPFQGNNNFENLKTWSKLYINNVVYLINKVGLRSFNTELWRHKVGVSFFLSSKVTRHVVIHLIWSEMIYWWRKNFRKKKSHVRMT